MSEKVVLQASRRDVIGKQVKALRREGKLPAVVYGQDFPPTPIVLDSRSAVKSLRHVTSSTLLTIDIDGAQQMVLVRDRQDNRLRDMLMHVDFMAVSMDRVLRVDVPLRLVGLAPAIKEFNAMIIQEHETLEVEALPGDLPEFIEVDITGLTHLGKHVTVGDIDLGEKVRILTEPESVIAVALSAASTEAEEVVEAVEEIEPEVIERGRRDEDED